MDKNERPRLCLVYVPFSKYMLLFYVDKLIIIKLTHFLTFAIHCSVRRFLSTNSTFLHYLFCISLTHVINAIIIYSTIYQCICK